MNFFRTAIIVSTGIILMIITTFLIGDTLLVPKDSNAAEDIFVEYDVSYGTHPKQKLDLCRPADITQPLPAVVLIHGGGGDKSDYTSICKKLAEKGIVAAAINFREEPSPAHKVILADNRAALAWLASQENVDVERMGSWGGSLGGYLSSMAGTVEHANKVKCVNNNFGPTDFTDPSDTESSPLYEKFVETFFGGMTYEENPALHERLSPITHVSSDDAGAWLFTRSTNDELVPRTQITKMMEVLEASGIQTEFYEYEGKGRGHANKLGPLQGWRLYNKRLDFMTSCLSNL